MANKRALFDNSTILLALFLSELIEPKMIYHQHYNIATDRRGEVFTVRCDFCYNDIFHRHYHCEACNSYDLCLNCYSMGQICEHVTEMKMHQGPKTLNNYINLYKEYIQTLNQVIGSQISYYCEEHKEKFISNF